MPKDGYAANGNLVASSDSVMGDWVYGYDTLNRLTGAVNALSTTAAAQYANATGCWSYDGFGNRGQEAFSTVSSTPCASGANDNLGTPVSRAYTALNRDTGFSYDAAGNVLNDGLNTYLYDGEGRLCAVKNRPCYLHTVRLRRRRNARGQRNSLDDARSRSHLRRAHAANGYTPSALYLLDQGGDQVTELNTKTGQWHGSTPTFWLAGISTPPTIRSACTSKSPIRWVRGAFRPTPPEPSRRTSSVCPSATG